MTDRPMLFAKGRTYRGSIGFGASGVSATLSGVDVVRALQAGDPETIGPYRLVGQLGRGGMGLVFLGLSAGGRPVAVKAIRAELAADPDFRRRFRQEVAAARRVNGLFTAMVVDADVDGPVAWLATAYVPGPSLTEAVTDHGPLPAESLLALAAGLAESLNAIHAAGVVHRDLKPSNVLLSEDGPRVIDFGISRAVESTSLTQAGMVIGSPGFMSPEQAEGFDVGPPSDIFSLGAVLAYAAAGQGPFGAGTTAAMLYRVVHGEPHLEQVPADVRPLVERCLAKNPLQRPTAGGLLAEVGALQPSGDWLPESIVRAMSGAPATAAPAIAAAAGGVSSASFQDTLASRPGHAPSSESQLLAPRASLAPMTATSGRVPPTPASAYPVSPTPSPADAYPVPLPPLSAPPIDRRPRRKRRAPLLAWVFGGAIVVGAGIGLGLTAAMGHHPKAPLQTNPAALTSAPTSGSPVRGAASSRAASPSAVSSVSSYASPSSIASASASARSSPSASVHTSKSPTASPSASQSSSPSASASPSPSTSPSPTSSPTPSPTPSTSVTSSPTTSASTVASTSPSSSAST
jgi:eukaryotic-like serine/threonine-protein kinase